MRDKTAKYKSRSNQSVAATQSVRAKQTKKKKKKEKKSLPDWITVHEATTHKHTLSIW